MPSNSIDTTSTTSRESCRVPMYIFADKKLYYSSSSSGSVIFFLVLSPSCPKYNIDFVFLFIVGSAFLFQFEFFSLDFFSDSQIKLWCLSLGFGRTETKQLFQGWELGSTIICVIVLCVLINIIMVAYRILSWYWNFLSIYSVVFSSNCGWLQR